MVHRLKKGSVPLLIFILLLTGNLYSETQDYQSKSYFTRYYNGFKNIWNLDYQKTIYTIGVIAIPLSFALDNAVNSYIQDHSFYPDYISNIGDVYGHRRGYYIAFSAVVAVNYYQGNSFRKTWSDANLMLESVLTSAAITELLKWGINRQRPIGYGADSFPSGHTSGAFALAVVLDHLYGKAIGYMSYGMAFFVGSSRINDRKHYLSDVVTGAIIGALAGQSFTKEHKQDIAISCYPSVKGIQLQIRYAL